MSFSLFILTLKMFLKELSQKHFNENYTWINPHFILLFPRELLKDVQYYHLAYVRCTCFMMQSLPMKKVFMLVWTIWTIFCLWNMKHHPLKINMISALSFSAIKTHADVYFMCSTMNCRWHPTHWTCPERVKWLTYQPTRHDPFHGLWPLSGRVHYWWKSLVVRGGVGKLWKLVIKL